MSATRTTLPSSACAAGTDTRRVEPSAISLYCHAGRSPVARSACAQTSSSPARCRRLVKCGRSSGFSTTEELRRSIGFIALTSAEYSAGTLGPSTTWSAATPVRSAMATRAVSGYCTPSGCPSASLECEPSTGSGGGTSAALRKLRETAVATFSGTCGCVWAFRYVQPLPSDV